MLSPRERGLMDCGSSMGRRLGLLAVLMGCGLVPAWSQCPEEPALANYTGAGQTVCPCFVPGEEAGAVFTLPPGDFPIEILRVGIAWGSQFGGSPQALEQAIHIYEGGLPDPGAPVFTLEAPRLTDGVINEFDLEPLPGEIVINSGPFTVTLEFLNQSADNFFAPSVVHDGNGCQPGKNVVFAGDSWIDACLLGVTGDWVFFVVYRPAVCVGSGAGQVPDGGSSPGTPLAVDLFLGGPNLLLSWGGSCTATDDDYEVYEGSLDSFYSHSLVLCSTGGAAGAIVAPLSGSTYYLVVPQNGAREGSYGRRSSGVQRPPGVTSCLPQEVAVCP